MLIATLASSAFVSTLHPVSLTALMNFGPDAQMQGSSMSLRDEAFH
jgi:hypothetical protein